MLRAAADDDAVAGFRGVLNDAFGDLQDAFAVHDIELVRVEAAFVAAAQKGFEEPVIERVGAFLAYFDNGFGAIGQTGDFLGQILIPKLPAELLSNLLGDFAAAASVFAFDGENSDHLLSLEK